MWIKLRAVCAAAMAARADVTISQQGFMATRYAGKIYFHAALNMQAVPRGRFLETFGLR